MVLRLAAAAIVCSFIFSTPLTAGTSPVEHDWALALPELEAVTQVPLELASPDRAVLVQLSPIDLPGPLLAFTAEQIAAEVVEVAGAAEADDTGREIDVLASLGSEWFVDRNEGETFALIAADLATAGDLTTGSIVSDRRDLGFVAVTGDHGEFLGADDALAPSVDNATSFEEQPIP